MYIYFARFVLVINNCECGAALTRKNPIPANIVEHLWRRQTRGISCWGEGRQGVYLAVGVDKGYVKGYIIPEQSLNSSNGKWQIDIVVFLWRNKSFNELA